MQPDDQDKQFSCAQVLCVDDDPILRSLLRVQIDAMVDRFDEAEDGLEAWARLRSHTYDLMFIDLEMPNLDGFDLIRCIRGNNTTRHVPIVVMSSRDDSNAIQTALQLGASSYLIKPINWSLFQPMVAQLLRLAGMARQFDELMASQGTDIFRSSTPASKIITALEANLLQISNLAARARATNDPKTMTNCLSEISMIAEGAMSSIGHEGQQGRSIQGSQSDDRRLTA